MRKEFGGNRQLEIGLGVLHTTSFFKGTTASSFSRVPHTLELNNDARSVRDDTWWITLISYYSMTWERSAQCESV